MIGYLPPRDEALIQRDQITAFLPWYWRKRKRAKFWLCVDGYATARANMAVSANHPQVVGDVSAISEAILERLEGREGRRGWARST